MAEPHAAAAVPPLFVGIDDVSKDALDAFVDDGTPAGRALRVDHADAGIARLVALLRDRPVARVVVESTGRYHRALAAELAAADVPVAVVNPRQVRDFARATGDVREQRGPTPLILRRRDRTAPLPGRDEEMWAAPGRRCKPGLRLGDAR